MSNPKKGRRKKKGSSAASDKVNRIDAELKAKEEQIKELRKKVERKPRLVIKHVDVIGSLKKGLDGLGSLGRELGDSFQKVREKSKEVLQKNSHILKGLNVYIKRIVTTGKDGVNKGVKFAGLLADGISENVQSRNKLRKIREKIRLNFNQAGTRIYQLYLEGEKNVLEDEKVKKSIIKIEEYEQKIEKIESGLIKSCSKLKE